MQISLPGVVITNGQLEIGLRSDASAGNYCSLDDVELVPTALAATPAAGAANAPQLYPNPGRGPLTLRYELPSAGPVQVALYAATGQLVQTLADLPTQPAGLHTLPLVPTATLAAGAYVLVLRSGPQQWHVQLLLP
ncbi:MAG: T9SS type A sorting domain-containing protein [Janthinobacterium lividum]